MKIILLQNWGKFDLLHEKVTFWIKIKLNDLLLFPIYLWYSWAKVLRMQADVINNVLPWLQDVLCYHWCCWDKQPFWPHPYEDARDDVTIKLVRFLPTRRGFKTNENEKGIKLMKVAHQNLRKYLAMKAWGSFILIQKTCPRIDMSKPEEQANNVWSKSVSNF